ncbi:cation diffusion facilitator family transporter [Leptospira wolffii]|uniref:Cation diffusion facilitator family transporter n=1 Tax=Leptospira wolffii TaxID=409998 RepID=A0ABV5BSL0_9LEPT
MKIEHKNSDSDFLPFGRQTILRPGKKGTVKTLIIAFFLSLIIFFWEIFGSSQSKSLALLADAGHVISDAFAFLLSISAVLIADRKPSPKMNFGFFRVEVFAAFLNSLLISGISVYIIFEAIERFKNHVEVLPDSMLIFSLGTIGFNMLSVLLLSRIAENNINLRSAYLHVLSDLLGTVSVLVGAVIIRFTGWNWVDPILSLILSLVILKSAGSILKESITILLEASPTSDEWDHLQKDVLAIPGTKALLSAHTWTLTKGIHACAFRILIVDRANQKKILQEAYSILRGEWKFEQIYIQLEDSKTAQILDGIVAKTLHDIGSEEWGHHQHTHDHSHLDHSSH